MSEVSYGRTPQGQLLYDLAFAQLTPKHIARKHGIPIESVRRMLTSAAVKKLIKLNRREGWR